jgi:hypothetical protein
MPENVFRCHVAIASTGTGKTVDGKMMAGAKRPLMSALLLVLPALAVHAGLTVLAHFS